MLLVSQCEGFPLTQKELEDIWSSVRSHTNAPDDTISLQCVSEDEIRRLNGQYRNKDSSTNILTFSYEAEHDIALCMDVAMREAAEHGVVLRDYVALLVVHGLLHVSGMDHERSAEESALTQEVERNILSSCGFVPKALSDVY